MKVTLDYVDHRNYIGLLDFFFFPITGIVLLSYFAKSDSFCMSTSSFYWSYARTLSSLETFESPSF